MMTDIDHTILVALGLCYALWIFYLAVMNLARVKEAGKLSKPALLFAFPVLAIGFALDVLVNVLVCTIAFVELPKELTVTSRVTRWTQQSGWRAHLAAWICIHLLDQFDPSGSHCK